MPEPWFILCKDLGLWLGTQGCKKTPLFSLYPQCTDTWGVIVSAEGFHWPPGQESWRSIGHGGTLFSWLWSRPLLSHRSPTSMVLSRVLLKDASGLQLVRSSPVPFMQTLVLLPEADRAEVSRFAKNFLPILFNLYGQPVAAGDTPAPRRAVLETIKTYLTITDPQVS